MLKNFPVQYIHEPWNAPDSVQWSAKCIIGKDYPLPMVNHVVASRINMERMKQVYQQLTHYRGNGNGLGQKNISLNLRIYGLHFWNLGLESQNLMTQLPQSIKMIQKSEERSSNHLKNSIEKHLWNFLFLKFKSLNNPGRFIFKFLLINSLISRIFRIILFSFEGYFFLIFLM